MKTYHIRARVTVPNGTEVDVARLVADIPGVFSQVLTIREVADPHQPSPRKRNFSRYLHAAEGRGLVIVASVGPIGMKGEPVEYAPRNRGDSRPWRPKKAWFASYRLTGRECHAVDTRTILAA